MHVLKVSLAPFLVSLPLTANAGEWWYVETPEFMKYEQEISECHHKSGSHRDFMGNLENFTFVNCNPIDMSLSSRDTYSTVATDGNSTFVRRESVMVTVQCEDGICSNRDTGEYLGRASVPNPISFSVQRGYYVYQNSDGLITQYKKGAGPLANDMFVPYVEEIVVQSKSDSQYDLFDMRYEVAYVDCTEGNVDQCIVGFDKFSGDKEGLYAISEIISTLEFADLDDPNAAAFHPDCWNGQCMTGSGNFMGLDPNYLAFQ